MMELTPLLTDLGRDIGIDLSAAIASGSCTIEFSTSTPSSPLEIILEATDDEGVPQSLLHLHAVIGNAPVLGAEALFGKLLQMHVLGIATMQGMFGYDAALRRILFFRSLSLPTLTQTEAMKAMASFVNQAERWRDHLPKLAGSGNAPPVLPDFLSMA